MSIFNVFWKTRWPILSLLLCSIVSGCLFALIPAINKTFYERFFIAPEIEFLLQFFVIFIFLAVAIVILNFGGEFCENVLRNEMFNAAYTWYSDELLNSPPKNTEAFSNGELIKIFNEDIPAFSIGCAKLIQVLGWGIFLFIANFALLYFDRHVWLGMVAMLVFAIIWGVVWKPVLKIWNIKLSKSYGEIYSKAWEYVPALKDIKLRRIELDVANEFRLVQNGLRWNLRVFGILNSLFWQIGFLFPWISYCLVLYIGTNRLFSNDVSPAKFLAILGFVFVFTDPIIKIVSSLTELESGVTAYRNICAKFNRNENTRIMFVQATVSDGIEIVLKNVSVFIGEKLILDNITMTFSPGKIYAITGPSGSGKSTLLKFLSGFGYNFSGEFFVNGKRITNSTSLETIVCYLPQETFIFDGTVAENSICTNNNQIHDLMAQLNFNNNFMETGAETVIGRGGIDPSGGEKQRISIIRALIDSRRLFALDEITSSLDLSTEYAALGLLRKKTMGGNSSIITVTHRESVANFADSVIVLKHGQIDEIFDVNNDIETRIKLTNIFNQKGFQPNV